MSRKIYMLYEIRRVECSKKLLSLRISRIIKMKIETVSENAPFSDQSGENQVRMKQTSL